MIKRIGSGLVVAVLAIASTGCALKFEGKGQASFLSGLNRETRQEAETAAFERTIVCGLLRESHGEDSYAVAFLKAKGYNDDAVAQRIAIARALPEEACFLAPDVVPKAKR